MDGSFINNIAYADDGVLLANSVAGLTHLLKNLQRAALKSNLELNLNKTKVLSIVTLCKQQKISVKYLKIKLNNVHLSYLDYNTTTKYKGLNFWH